MRIEFGYQGEWIVYEMNPQEPDYWESDGRFDYHYCEEYNQVCVYIVDDTSKTIHTQPIRIGFVEVHGSQAIGTSWHGAVVKASVRELTDILGEPSSATNDGKDKTNFEWDMQTTDGDVFTVYDWKEYRVLDLDEPIEWHIGCHRSWVGARVSNLIMAELIRKEVADGNL